MRLVYVAHPVAPADGETVEGNAEQAERWLVALTEANPGIALIAPWTTMVRRRPGDDADPAARALSLATCAEVASRCDEIALCGPRISRGMLEELRAVGCALASCYSPPPIVHRFSRPTIWTDDLRLPSPPACHTQDRQPRCFDLRTSRLLYGACPESTPEAVAAEIEAAARKYRA